MSSSDIVKLDIGGTVFKTTKSTLTKYDGFFKTLLETSVSVKQDEAGCIFIDRDPKHFRLVLNFMRDEHVALPSSEQYVQDILKEADYYLLQGLVELCGGSLPVAAKTEVSKGVRVVESFDEVLKNRDFKKTLVNIKYNLEVSADFLRSSDSVLSFVQKHESRYDIFFQTSKELTVMMSFKSKAWCLQAPRCTNIDEVLIWVEGRMEKFYT